MTGWEIFLAVLAIAISAMLFLYILQLCVGLLIALFIGAGAGMKWLFNYLKGR